MDDGDPDQRPGTPRPAPHPSEPDAGAGTPPSSSGHVGPGQPPPSAAVPHGHDGTTSASHHAAPQQPGPPGPPVHRTHPGDEGQATPVQPTRRRRSDRERSSTKGSFLRELPVLLLIALVLAFLLRTFVLQVFYIPSSSMEDTLSVNDRMVVEKVTYLFRAPQRGEVVVFEGDELGELDPDATVGERVVRGVGQFLGLVPASARDFVKRVIGLPGDEIRIEDGQVYVNGAALDEPYVTYEDESDFGPVTVPDDALFFLGDNRPNSSDSRRSLGFVEEDAVVGRSAVIIWPFENRRMLTETRHQVPEPGG